MAQPPSGPSETTSVDTKGVPPAVSDPNVTKLYGVGGACAALALAIALSSFKMFLGLIIGAVISVVGIYGALYYLLNIAEAKVLEDRKDEVKKKEDQPKLETKVRGLWNCSPQLLAPLSRRSTSCNQSLPPKLTH